MADSFTLLSAKISIQFEEVKKAFRAVTELEQKVQSLGRKKVSSGGFLGLKQAHEGQAKAKQTTKSVEDAAKASKKFEQALVSADLALHRIQRSTDGLKAKLASLTKLRGSILAGGSTAGVTEAQALRAERLAKRVAAAQAKIQGELTKKLDAAKFGADADKVTQKARQVASAVASMGFAFSNIPGLPKASSTMVRLFANLANGFGKVLSLGAKFGPLAITIGVLGSVLFTFAGLALSAATAVLKLGVALARGAISLAFKGLKVAVTALLTPLRALIFELQQLANPRALVQFGTGLVKAAASMDTIRKQFQIAFGAGAEQEFERLRKEVQFFGTDLEEVTRGFAKFAIAAQASGIELKVVRDLFTGTQAAARVFGLGTEQVKDILVALEQIASRGTLSSEELKRQLGNNLPSAFALAAKSLNKTTEELTKALEAGSIGAKTFLNAFSTALITEFFQKAASLTDSLQARLGRLSTAAFLLKSSLGDLVSNTFFLFFERFAQAAFKAQIQLRGLRNFFALFTKFFQRSIEGIGIDRFVEQLLEAFTRLLGPLRNFADAFARLSIFLSGTVLAFILELAKRALPFLTRGLTAVIRKIQDLTGLRLDSLNNVFISLAAILKSMPVIVSELATVFQALIASIAGFFKRFAAAFSTLVGQTSLLTQIIVKTIAQLAGAFAGAFAMAAKDMFDPVIQSAAIAMENIRKELEKNQREMEKQFGNAPEGGKLEIEGTEAAKEIAKALNSKTADIIDVEDFVRKLNAAGTVATQQQLQQKTNLILQQIADNTQKVADQALQTNQLKTPFRLEKPTQSPLNRGAF